VCGNNTSRTEEEHRDQAAVERFERSFRQMMEEFIQISSDSRMMLSPQDRRDFINNVLMSKVRLFLLLQCGDAGPESQIATFVVCI
jgi:hypothetical protein